MGFTHLPGLEWFHGRCIKGEIITKIPLDEGMSYFYDIEQRSRLVCNRQKYSNHNF